MKITLSVKDKETQEEALREAIAKAGNQEKLAEQLTKVYGDDVKRSMVADWLRHGVRESWVPYLVKVSGIKASRFHPTFKLME